MVGLFAGAHAALVLYVQRVMLPREHRKYTTELWEGIRDHKAKKKKKKKREKREKKVRSPCSRFYRTGGLQSLTGLRNPSWP